MSTPEEMFPPKPGGMVDTAIKRAKAEADQLEAHNAQPSAPMGASDFAPIRVRTHTAELARARTFSVSTGNNNPIVELLGRDENRSCVVIMTLDEPVVISFSAQAADDPRNAVNAAGLSANGFVLPVNQPVTFPTKSIVYCTALSGTATRVSVAAFSFAEG